jgi:serine/threonine protein phosphatase PrpC
MNLEGDEAVLVVASDGVWEFISNEEAFEVILKYFRRRDLESGCQELL